MEHLIISVLQQAKTKPIDNQHASQRSGCSAWKNGTLAGVIGRKKGSFTHF